IYNKIKDVSIVDISHEIKPFDIAHAAYVLKNCYKEFPIGTIHIIGVNPEETSDFKHVVVKQDGHFFIGADNGVFSLIFNETPQQIYQVTKSDNLETNYTFPTKSVFVEVAQKIVNNVPLEEIGVKIEQIKRRQLFR